ncbi:hypothetical protein L873DRAFT_874020 [Choiromyces venosus 120613-1]|uniref:Uncharacterized protein n=1 Tax=Choiromyces venosus 120613-1 TaxID=1336337 RepID=A0A3N4JN76_9PEZI|nr:hypothetical protein L873DRAFT_874020 [Choiromyces venosus 120613-1]
MKLQFPQSILELSHTSPSTYPFHTLSTAFPANQSCFGSLSMEKEGNSKIGIKCTEHLMYDKSKFGEISDPPALATSIELDMTKMINWCSMYEGCTYGSYHIVQRKFCLVGSLRLVPFGFPSESMGVPPPPSPPVHHPRDVMEVREIDVTAPYDNTLLVLPSTHTEGTSSIAPAFL